MSNRLGGSYRELGEIRNPKAERIAGLMDLWIDGLLQGYEGADAVGEKS